MKEHTGLAKDVSIFNMPQAAKKDLISAGEKFLLHWYGASDFTSLDAFRYYAYTPAIAKKYVKDSFNLATLPPTSAAAKQHILRTYLQVQQWIGNELEPTDWGWRVYMDTLIPVPTDQPPAPERLLNLVSYKCNTGCSRGCGCRRVGAMLTNVRQLHGNNLHQYRPGFWGLHWWYIYVRTCPRYNNKACDTILYIYWNSLVCCKLSY